MMKSACVIGVAVSMFFAAGCDKSSDDWKGTIELVEGVTMVSNPEIPINGVVLLELEKALEINPFENPDIGIEYLYSAKDLDGEVILYDANRAEAHRFSSDGEYIGNLVRNGEGPGEFQQFRGFKVQFRNSQIWAFSSGKLAKFDKEGVFIEEWKLSSSPSVLIDDKRYLGIKREQSEEGQARQVTLTDIVKEEHIVFFEATKEWMIWKGQSAFSNPWATPSIIYAFSLLNAKVYVALNEVYEVNVYDLDGTLSQVIRRPHERASVSSKDIDIVMGRTMEREAMKWIYNAFPDKLTSIRDIKVLPRGYIGVYRIVGPKLVEIDVYNIDGKLTHVLQLPEGVSIENAQFYEFGFVTTITRDEYPIYVEYNVMNVPDIFTK